VISAKGEEVNGGYLTRPPPRSRPAPRTPHRIPGPPPACAPSPSDGSHRQSARIGVVIGPPLRFPAMRALHHAPLAVETFQDQRDRLFRRLPSAFARVHRPPSFLVAPNTPQCLSCVGDSVPLGPRPWTGRDAARPSPCRLPNAVPPRANVTAHVATGPQKVLVPTGTSTRRDDSHEGYRNLMGKSRRGCRLPAYT